MLRNIVNLGGRLLIICLAAALALAATYNLTAPVKAANEAAKEQAALREVYPEAQEFTALSDEELSALQGSFPAVQGVYRTDDGGALVTVTVQGYNQLTVMVGVKADGIIAGYEVLAHTETANLGDKVTKPEFSEQFRGQATPFHYGSGVEAISGATKSSNAILEAVNMAASVLAQLGGAK